MKRNTLLASLLVAGILACLVLGSYQTSQAAQKQDPAFFNSLKQRMEMVNELKEIATLLREQNQLLKKQNAILEKSVPRK
ncbi:MAG: hypothetical protein U9N87_13480 [Planctomycetota bacterium]|nr:hypothetical protein [Planctomycetota bacterium]